MSPEDIEKIKSGIHEDYMDIMDPDEEEEAGEYLLALAQLSLVDTFVGLVKWLKIEGDWEQALGYILFGLSSADYEDLNCLLTTDWRS